jgi:Multicopper oxidase
MRVPVAGGNTRIAVYHLPCTRQSYGCLPSRYATWRRPTPWLNRSKRQSQQGWAASRGIVALALDISLFHKPPLPALTAVPAYHGLGELRSAAVAARRQLVLAAGMGMGAGMMRFTINGMEFNEARTDTTVAAGNVEEWTLTNTSPMDHPFHLHVWPMQVIEEDGQGMDTAVWQDVVNVPANRRVKVRVASKDFRGRSVYRSLVGELETSVQGCVRCPDGGSRTTLRSLPFSPVSAAPAPLST